MKTFSFSIDDEQYDKAIQILSLQTKIPCPDYKITSDVFVDFVETLPHFLDEKLREIRMQVYSK
jgi:hypothetical protein